MNRTKKSHSRSGIVLILTLVILVILASIGYSLSASVVTRRHRIQYMIDYQIARYACDSAVKYAMSSIGELDTAMIERVNLPDFSDVFRLTAEEYQLWLDDYNAQMEFPSDDEDDQDVSDSRNLNSKTLTTDDQDQYDSEELAEIPLTFIPGPYGQQWPIVGEPVEFEIGSAVVNIQVEDENAKFPLVLALLTEGKLSEEAHAATETFFEWMQMDMTEIEMLFEQLDDVSEIKQFKAEYIKKEGKGEKEAESKPKTTSGRRRRTRRKSTKDKEKEKAEKALKLLQIDFANLLQSPLIDTDVLSRNTIEDDERIESALKYLGVWGSHRVNVNTAPRNVLESIFVLGSLSDSVDIAEVIIRKRQEKPFKDLKELKSSLLGYSDVVDRCEDFLVTKSQFFTIRMTVINGLAKITCVAAFKVDGKKTELVAMRYQ